MGDTLYVSAHVSGKGRTKRPTTTAASRCARGYACTFLAVTWTNTSRTIPYARTSIARSCHTCRVSHRNDVSVVVFRPQSIGSSNRVLCARIESIPPRVSLDRAPTWTHKTQSTFGLNEFSGSNSCLLDYEEWETLTVSEERIAFVQYS